MSTFRGLFSYFVFIRIFSYSFVFFSYLSSFISLIIVQAQATYTTFRNEITRQFVNKRDGCLAVAEFTRNAIACGASPFVIHIDVKNAFNTLERDVFLSEAAKTPAARLCY